jgi:hypothetical protein
MKKYISFVLIAVLFAACTPNNEVGTPFKAGQEVSITAHMPNAGANHLPGKQRVSGKDAGTQIDLTWDADDQITVTVGDQSAIFTLTDGAGSSQATFTGTMPADVPLLVCNTQSLNLISAYKHMWRMDLARG